MAQTAHRDVDERRAEYAVAVATIANWNAREMVIEPMSARDEAESYESRTATHVAPVGNTGACQIGAVRQRIPLRGED